MTIHSAAAPPQLAIGMRVVKSSGAYEGSHWIVVGSAVTQAGKLRIVAESCDIPGLLHIFDPAQLVNVLDLP